MEYKDYYKTLGVHKSASKDEIKKAYRKLARTCHPDVNPNDKESALKFAEIGEAHEVLSDDENRKKYDELGADWRQYQSTGGPQGFDWSKYAAGGASRGNGQAHHYSGTGGDWQDMFGGDDAMFSDFFKNMFGRGHDGSPRGERQGPRGFSGAGFAFKGQDLSADITISLDEAYSGCTRIIGVDGKKMRINLDPGIKDGQTIKLTGKGGVGSQGAPAGDVYLTVKVAIHPEYRRQGSDLFTDVPVDLYTAILGGDLDVHALSGTFKLKIPPETQSGTTFRLKKRGFPTYEKKDRFGDLYVRVVIRVPTNLSNEEKELVKRLAALRTQPAGSGG
ncbi:MAG: J domain-containing protein [Alkalispirochaeta sp.]